MGLGVHRAMVSLYIRMVIVNYSLTRWLWGAQNANRLLKFIDKRAIVPILRKYGAHIGKECDIEQLVVHNCTEYSNLRLGQGCHIGKETFLDLRAPIVCEDGVTISMRVSLLTHIDVGKSPLANLGFASLHKGITLRSGCYIGAGAIILHGIEIGECAVVGAGAVVSKDVAPYTVVGGIPARVIKTLK
jgi:acetyltransferase-like isoleucine patch superfamily enzyme